MDLTSLRELAQRVRANDPSLHSLSFFRTPTDAELADLKASVDQLAKTADRAAEELLMHLEVVASEPKMEDLCGIVRAEIDIERSRLGGLRKSGNTWELGVAAVATMSRLGKATAAIENTLCDLRGVDRRLSVHEGLEVALAIRKAYAKLWSAIPAETGGDTTVEKKLRRGATAMASLVGRNVFLDLRATDRRLLLESQRRIRKWLASGGTSEDGDQLWSDFSSFVSLLRLINQRSVLIEHDLQLLPEMQAHLGSADPASKPLLEDVYCREKIRRLRGRSSVLDEMLKRPDEVTSQELLQALGAIEIEIFGSTMGQPMKPSRINNNAMDSGGSE